MKKALILSWIGCLLLPLLADDQTLIYLRFSDSTSLDPGKARDQFSGAASSNIFEGLVRYNTKTGTIEPCLALNWKTSPDKKKWIFSLRKGVYFHNGLEFDAYSVVYSFRKRMQNPREYIKWKLFFPHLVQIKKLDKHAVEVSLSKTYAPFLTALSDPVAFIVARGSYENAKFMPIGTGPFRFSSWKKGESIVLERNDRYWEKKIRISKIIFRVMENPGWRIKQLESGNADVLSIRSANEYDQFLWKRGIHFITAPSQATFFLAFNTAKKPFDRKEVRQAFSHLIDKKVMIKQIFQNFAHPTHTLLHPQVPGFHNLLGQHEFSLGKALDLLKKAGHENGFTCTLYFLRNDVGEQKIADIFVRNAQRINVRVIKKSFAFRELFDTIKNKEYDLVIRGWVAGPDPDIYLYANFTLGEGNMNWSNYRNARLISLLNQGRETLDPFQRIAIYRKAQEIIHREVPLIPLYRLNYLTVLSSKVKNIYFDSNSNITFKEATKENHP